MQTALSLTFGTKAYFSCSAKYVRASVYSQSVFLLLHPSLWLPLCHSGADFSSQYVFAFAIHGMPDSFTLLL